MLRRALWRFALALVAIAAALAVVARLERDDPAARVVIDDRLRDELPAPGLPEPSVEAPALAEPATVERSDPEPTPAAAPPSAVDPCADSEDDPRIERPSIGTLVGDRIAELNDRMRAAMRRETASAALREGLRLGVDPSAEDQALRLLASAPDRVEDGFDYRVAVLVALAGLAREDDPRRARRLSAMAVREAPGDPLPLVLQALCDEDLGDVASATDALVRAHAADPSEPSIALALGRHLRDGPDAAAAVAAFDAYLREVPDDAAIRRWRERMARRVEATRGHRTTSRGALTILAPAATDAHVIGSALDTIDAALTRSARLLGVERPAALTILAYADRSTMRRTACAPEWTGALFDGVLHVPVEELGTANGRLSLQHESLHAALRSALPTTPVPTWLNEGIAQYFAPEHGEGRSFRLMVEEHAVIPLESMTGAFMVIDDGADARLAYHQALAMVLWLVERRGERGIAEAIDYLEGGGDPARVLFEVTHVALDREVLRTFVATRLEPAR